MGPLSAFLRENKCLRVVHNKKNIRQLVTANVASEMMGFGSVATIILIDVYEQLRRTKIHKSGSQRETVCASFLKELAQNGVKDGSEPDREFWKK